MTEQHSRGVLVLTRVLKDLSRLDPERSRAIFDGLTDQETADVLALHASALALDPEERDVFVESVADRIHEVSHAAAQQ